MLFSSSYSCQTNVANVVGLVLKFAEKLPSRRQNLIRYIKLFEVQH
jgi:hypothetical protein